MLNVVKILFPDQRWITTSKYLRFPETKDVEHERRKFTCECLRLLIEPYLTDTYIDINVTYAHVTCVNTPCNSLSESTWTVARKAIGKCIIFHSISHRQARICRETISLWYVVISYSIHLISICFMMKHYVSFLRFSCKFNHAYGLFWMVSCKLS